ncbi:RE1-silencing transcription factor [Eleutherodactylus coqui]|uniref:RE1-silencing transcription factor n=1 Tax=Eleutherodactylus coqui TaxID=57060 RepID=UPI0034637006
MATEMVSHPSGSNLFCNSGNFGIGDMYGLHDLSKAEMAAPRLIMLANVALTGDVSNGCCDYSLDEDRQMAELTTVYENSFSDSDGERMELEESDPVSESGVFDTMEIDPSEVQEEKLRDQQATSPETRPEGAPENKNQTLPSRTEDKTKCVKSKPFRCRPCQYKAESEEDFVHHIKDHSAKRFIDHDSNKAVQDSGSCSPEEVDFSKGPILCDRCGYNTNRFDHYLAHLKHHSKAADNERVYKCTICTYTTVSEYHWKKHLRNHFPRIVYTCSQCSYFSDRKNNYIQHIRTHTGERPYQCVMCPYSSSQKTHLTRHMRTHSGEKPFKCEQCSYVASNQHEVTRHARQVHNGPKPLTCPHCNYKTADRSNFKKHVELHVNPRQFMCPVCDYAASKKCNLQYHIKSRHSGCTDISMDVSKVKLRTKKGDAVSSDVNSNKQEDNENSNAESEPPEKQAEVIPKADKEKCIKVKQASIPPVGQITTRSHKPSSSKIEEDTTADTNADKGKCAKRKSSVVSEKPAKVNDMQNANLKKRRLGQKSKHAHDIPRKAVGAGKSEKQKVSLKKTNLKKPLKNKHKKKTVSAKTSTSKKASGKSTTEKEKAGEDSEGIELKDPVDGNTDVPLTGNGLLSWTDPTQEEVTTSTTATEGSDLDAESKTEESTVSDASLPDPTVNWDDSTVNWDLSTINPESSTVNRDSSTVNPDLSTVNPDLSTINPDSSTVNRDSSTINPDSSTVNPDLSTISPDSSTMEITLESDPLLSEKNSDIKKVNELDPNSVISPITDEPVLETQSAPDTQPSSVSSPTEESEPIPEVHCNTEVSVSHCSDSASEEDGNLNDSASNSSLEGRAGPEQITPSDETEQCPSAATTQSISDCEPKETAHAQCEAAGHEALDIEEDEGIHSHEGSDISDNVSERSDDSGLNGLQSPQETLESRPLLEVPSASTSVANENFVCIFCDRVFKKAEEYTKHLKRHLVNVYYLEKAAQN